VNGRGELVGINSMIVSESGGNQGIGFAIPANVARDIMDQLIQHGAVQWGSIGQVSLRAIDRATARYNGLGDQAGVAVLGLSRASAAARGGLQRYDLIVSMNGQPIADVDQLSRLIIKSSPGSSAKFEVLRDGRKMPLTVPIVSR
jgi:S1-C subfamily serine protease